MSFCVVVIWFNVASAAYRQDDPADWRSIENCKPLEFWESLLSGVIRGQVVKLAVKLPVEYLARLQRLDFVYSSEWDDESREKQLHMWKCKGFVFWMLGTLWLLGAAAFLMLFWASVALDIQRDFVLVAGSYLVEHFLLDSVILACVFGICCGLAVWACPELVDQACDEYLNPSEEEVRQEEAEDKVQVVGQDAPVYLEGAMPWQNIMPLQTAPCLLEEDSEMAGIEEEFATAGMLNKQGSKQSAMAAPQADLKPAKDICLPGSIGDGFSESRDSPHSPAAPPPSMPVDQPPELELAPIVPSEQKKCTMSMEQKIACSSAHDSSTSL